jgi:hypothetical protein
MQVDPTSRTRIEHLEAFVGEWIEQVPDAAPGRTTFEWILGGQYLLQRSDIPHPDFPDSVALIAANPNGQGYTLHYFDSRGVVRVYAMTFVNSRWTLVRDASDVTPLDFLQRFIGTFSSDGNTINAAWETSADGVLWEHDFNLTYSKVR